MSFLALPTSSRNSPAPASSASPKRNGGGNSKKRQLDRLVLDEEDDVDDADLIVVPTRRRVNEDYDEDEDDEPDADADADVDVEGDADGEVDGEPGQEGRKAPGKGGAKGSGGAGGSREHDSRAESRAKIARGHEIDRKGKKRRAETFLLRDQLDPDQAKRFDTFSTVAINKNAIKRLNRDLYDQHCSPQVCMVVAGMAKIFVADVIELGPLQPYHLKLARMQLEQRGLLADQARSGGLRGKKGLFKRI
ncbi:hypothetical protein I316_05005 [Kwoniella heveanensis BCC8398]|uniref:TAFII28-like protein domain-containing protein n=1 Tax=Kwoniella heveanensis BCC8398 TaxID=1296120 RepID=A0A1B9GQ83_9TREE|nr:hypothetical protein I316_05005 [Kwoniella heveanensis BCC8398]